MPEEFNPMEENWFATGEHGNDSDKEDKEAIANLANNLEKPTDETTPEGTDKELTDFNKDLSEEEKQWFDKGKNA